MPESLVFSPVPVTSGHPLLARVHDPRGGIRQELRELLERSLGLRDGTHLVSALRVGNVVLVRPGESVPADGVVRKGASDLDEAMITGESRPVKKQEGDEVIAATINGAGALRVKGSSSKRSSLRDNSLGARRARAMASFRLIEPFARLPTM